MNIMTMRKITLTLILAVTATLLSFGSALAGIAVESGYHQGGNNGKTKLATDREPNTNVYYLANTEGKIKAAFRVSTQGSSFEGNVITPSIEDKASHWSVGWLEGETPEISNGGLKSIILVLTRENTTGFSSPETIEVKVSDNNSHTETFKFIVHPRPVSLSTAPSEITLLKGVSYDAEKVEVTPKATDAVSFNWTGVGFTKKTDGSDSIAHENGDIGDNTGIKAAYAENLPLISLGGKANAAMGKQAYYIFAKSMTLKEGEDRYDEPVRVAGFGSEPNGTRIGEVGIEIVEAAAMKLSRTIKGFLVGDTAGNKDDITVSFENLKEHKVTALEIASGEGEFGNEAKLGDLTIKTSLSETAGAITFTGTAAEAMSGKYRIRATLTGAPELEGITSDLTVAIVEKDAAFITEPTITAPGATDPVALKLNKQAKISFISPLTLPSIEGVSVNLPDGRSVKFEEPLEAEPTDDTGTDGYFVKKSGDATVIDIYLTPKTVGAYGFDITYKYDDEEHTQSIKDAVRAADGSGGGGGGCGAGFGIAGIIALAGFILAGRRRSR